MHMYTCICTVACKIYYNWHILEHFHAQNKKFVTNWEDGNRKESIITAALRKSKLYGNPLLQKKKKTTLLTLIKYTLYIRNVRT